MFRLLKYLIISALGILLLFDYFVMSPMYDFHRSYSSPYARNGGEVAMALNRTFYSSEAARRMWDVRMSELPKTKYHCRDGDTRRPTPAGPSQGGCAPFYIADLKTASRCTDDRGKCLEIGTKLSVAEFLNHKKISEFVTHRCEYFQSFIDETKPDQDKHYYEEMIVAIGCDGARNTGSVPIFIVGADGDIFLRI